VIEDGLPDVLERAGVSRDAIVGIGVDFTSCTVLPVTSDGVPLCTLERWRQRKHAWPKLWKHHAAQPIADRLNEVAIERGDGFLQRYGGRISSEWYFPKLIELWLEDREIYDEAAGFIEATDWIVWYLTGVECRQSATAGYKAMWSEAEGLPPTEYFEAAYPGFDRPAEKLGTSFVPLGTRAGTLRPLVAQRVGLSESVAVAVGNVDAWVSVPGLGVEEPGTFVIVIGTSICDMVVHPEETRLPGITGVVKDGILPGLYGYEAGQAAVGDMLAWFVENVASDAGGYEALEQAASAIGSGETGLIALDWWNGNRTILADADLSGAIFGLTLQTTREQIYRALLESIAFGSRRIMDNFEEHGLELSTIVACGGIAERSPLMMQLLADTSGREVHVPDVKEIPARGAALFGAVAAGVFDDIASAISATRPTSLRTYTPDPAAKQTYDRVYAIYRRLYEILGRSEVDLLHGLKRIRTERGAL
jgi:L-ribulokinase